MYVLFRLVLGGRRSLLYEIELSSHTDEVPISQRL